MMLSTVQVFPAGTTDEEIIDLEIDGAVVQTWSDLGSGSSSRDFVELSFTTPDTFRPKRAKWITNLGNTAQALVVDDWKAVASAARFEGKAALEAAGLTRVCADE